MNHKLQFLFTIFIAFFAMQIAISNTSDPAQETGTATGKLSVNNQTFFIKYAYAKKSKDNEGRTTFLVLLTNRPFPEDLSTLDRLDLSRFAERYDIQGVAIGIDENKHLFFTDILRFAAVTGAVEFKPAANGGNLIAGRLYTKRKEQYFNQEYETDISFNAKRVN